MESHEYMNARDELAERRFKTEQKLNDLTELKHKVKTAESEMQYDTAEDMRSLSMIEELLDEDRINVGEAAGLIRQQIKAYDESSRSYGEGEFAAFDKKIGQLEGELESIRREASSI